MSILLTFMIRLLKLTFFSTLAMAAFSGCVERTLSVQSNPPGALVYLNDQEVGRTPMSRDFTWYGTYDLAIRKDGYETIKTQAPIIAPIYEWVPIDLLAEILPIPFKDHRTLTYDLKPQPMAATQPDVQGLIGRGQDMRSDLETSQRAATKSGK